jgi:hypothetical protein
VFGVRKKIEACQNPGFNPVCLFFVTSHLKNVTNQVFKFVMCNMLINTHFQNVIYILICISLLDEIKKAIKLSS